MRRGDVYWVTFDPAARGGEVRKRRPAVIVSNNTANRTLNRVQVVPLTSNTERVYAAEAIVWVGDRANKAMANQLTTVAKERLLDYVDTLSPADLQAVEQAIRTQLDLR